MPLSARPSSRQLQSLSQTHSQPLAGQVHLNRGIGEDFFRLPVVIHSHPVPHPINYTPRNRERHVYPSDYIVRQRPSVFCPLTNLAY